MLMVNACMVLIGPMVLLQQFAKVHFWGPRVSTDKLVLPYLQREFSPSAGVAVMGSMCIPGE